MTATLPTAPDADRLLPIADARTSAATVWRLLRRRPAALAVVAGCSIITAGCGLVAPVVLGRLVDRLSADDTDAARPVVLAAVLVLLAGLVAAVSTWLCWRALARVSETTVAELREHAVDRALTLDAAVIERAGTGDLVSRVAEDSRLVAESTTQVLPLLLNAGFAVVVTAIGMLAVDWRLGLVGLVAVPMYALSLRWYLPRSGPYYAAERAAFATRAGHLLGGITGARTLRAYGAEAGELARIDASSAYARDLAIGVYAMLTRFFGRNNRAEAVVLGLLLGAGFWFVVEGWVSPGMVATATLLFHRLFNPIGALVGLFDDVQSALASLTRMVGVARAPVPARRGMLPTPRPAMLAARTVCHRYRDDLPVLTDIDLEVGCVEVVALVGSTGAGKTTLASIMAGVLPARSGVAMLDDVPVRSVPEPELRRVVCLVSQEVHTFAGTLYDDLTLGADDVTAEDVRAALAAVHADAWVEALPEGLQTRVGAGGQGLSVVQAQQIALARVLLADPAFVVLDEATAEAGSTGSRDLETAARAVIAGRGALVVAHRLSQARLADRVVVLEDGRIVEQGGHDELVAADGRYAELWAAWSSTQD